MSNCQKCSRPVSSFASKCGHCGSEITGSSADKYIGAVFVVAIIIALIKDKC